KSKHETLETAFHTLSAKLYQNAQGGGDPEQAPGADGFGTGATGANENAGAAEPDENIVDADFEVVDDDAPKEE
ncbi:MAG: hypothetical protein LBN36_05315, partial [Clostridiales Family XIII bacterium]|nr:hypothetical protein [Clostridiales Family XIII bacterium]